MLWIQRRTPRWRGSLRQSAPAGCPPGRRRATGRARSLGRVRAPRGSRCLRLFAQALIAARAELEHPLRHPPNLDLLGALGDPIAAVVAVDVFERLVPAVAESAVDLHGAVGG